MSRTMIMLSWASLKIPFPTTSSADEDVALGQQLHRLGDARRSLEQTLALGILANELQLAADQLLEFLIFLCIRHSCSRSPTARASSACRALLGDKNFPERGRRCSPTSE